MPANDESKSGNLSSSSTSSETSGQLKKAINVTASRCNSSKSSRSADNNRNSFSGKTERNGQQTASERSAHCYKQRVPVRVKCEKKFKWQTGEYLRDECGSGILPLTFNFSQNRDTWCKTPLSMYQATIGELGRRILCRVTELPRDIRPPPPSNIAEYILPFCRGYYRKYECIRPCEEQHATILQGKKVYRDNVTRYWKPCLTSGEADSMYINDYAHHNAILGKKMRRLHDTSYEPCW